MRSKIEIIKRYDRLWWTTETFQSVAAIGNKTRNNFNLYVIYNRPQHITLQQSGNLILIRDQYITKLITYAAQSFKHSFISPTNITLFRYRTRVRRYIDMWTLQE